MSRLPSARLIRANLVVAVALLAAGAGGAMAIRPGRASPLPLAILIGRSIDQVEVRGAADVVTTLSVGPGVASAHGTGTIDVREGRLALDLAMRLPGLGPPVPVEARFIGTRLYERAPGVSTVEPGRSWITIDLSRLGSAAGTSAGALGTAGNPAVILQGLGQSTRAVVAVGPAVVDGTDVQEYRLSALQEQGGPVYLYLYLDRSGRLRRFRSVGSITFRGHSTAVDQTLDFVRSRRPVPIPVPAPSQTVGFEQFLRDQARGRQAPGS